MDITWHWFAWPAAGLIAGAALITHAQSVSAKREHRIFSLGLVVAAAIYIVFGVLAGSMHWTIIGLIGVLVFIPFTLSKHQPTLWLACGWTFHIIWDIALHHVGQSVTVVPLWYMLLCAGFDAMLGVYLFLRQLVNHRLVR